MTDPSVVLVGYVLVFIPALIAAIAATRTTKKVHELHVLINSNLARQIAAEVSAAFAKGQLEGTQAGADLARTALKEARQQ